jgi:hypothetical protein
MGLFWKLTAGILLLSVPMAHGAPQLSPPEPKCDGYRYLYMESTERGKDPSKVRYHACRRILEPSSRPVACEQLGEIDMKKIEEEAGRVSEKLWQYRYGIALGTGCMILAQAATFFSQPISMGFRLFHRGNDTKQDLDLRQELTSGRRKLGELPTESSGRLSPVSSACSQLTASGEPAFRAGAFTAVKALSSLGHHARAAHADARTIRESPVGERAKKFDTYAENMSKRRKAQAKALVEISTAVGAMREFLLSHKITHLPVGLSGEIAITSPDTCIPESEVQELKKQLKALNELIEHGKLKLLPEEIPTEVAAPQRRSAPPPSEPPPAAIPAQ